MLIEDLKQEFDGADPDSDDVAMLRIVCTQLRQSQTCPTGVRSVSRPSFPRRHSRLVEARSKSDFSIFRPHLEKVVELVQKYVSFFPPGNHPYDTLLDDYEPGMKTEEVKAIFDGLRPKQVNLLKAIAASKQVKADFLYKKYNERS